MLLTIDVGNTNTVLGLFDGRELTRSFRIKTDARSTADELQLTFSGLMPGIAVTGVALCSTVPAVLRELREVLATAYADLPHVIIEPGVRTGVSVLMDNPREVGADRIANTVAAYAMYGGPSIVVDFGTSTNFDVISERGEFIGGALAPGVEISLDALAARAAALRKVEFVAPRNVIAKTTVEALQSGALYGFAGQVDGIVHRIIDELGAQPTAVIATGGLAPYVIPESSTVTVHRPDLTLQGLRLVFERNT